MFAHVFGATPWLLVRFLGVKQAALVTGGIVSIGVAVFLTPSSPEPNPAPCPMPDKEVAWVRSLAFAGNSLLVATGGGPVHQEKTSWLRFWDADSGRQRTVLAGHAGGIVAVAFSRDSRLAASADYDQTVRIWDVATGREQAVLQRPQNVCHHLAFDPAGRLAWIEDGFVRHWDPVTGGISVGPPTAVGEAVNLAFSPDGRLLATTGTAITDFATCLWELLTGALLAVLPPSPYAICCADFAASGRVLATGDLAGGVHLWDTDTGQKIRVLARLRTAVRALAFSADGSVLAAADVEDTIKLWDIATGRERESFSVARFFGAERRPDQ
jgi:WD40 repeat protein